MTIGIFGGTFNPVHWGHVRTAQEIKYTLSLEKMLLIPCGIPPHRAQPQANPENRLVMLKLAISAFPDLEVDEREIRRRGPSYSVDTLQSLRDESPGKSFAMCIGVDAFLGLTSWHRWQELFALAHIVVAHRPGWSLQESTNQLPKELKSELEKRHVKNVAELGEKNAGLIVDLNVTEIDISSSGIRKRIESNETISGLVPGPVEDYIYKHKLYRG